MYNPDVASIILESGFSVLLLYLGEYSNRNVIALGIKPIDSYYNKYKRVGLACTDPYCGNSGLKDLLGKAS
jgi:hypothetical protein